MSVMNLMPLKPKAAAVASGMPVHLLIKLAEDGAFPNSYRKKNGHWCIILSDVTAYQAANADKS